VNRNKSALMFFAVIMILIAISLIGAYLDIFGENSTVIMLVTAMAVLVISIVWLVSVVFNSKPTAVLTATGVDIKGPTIEMSVAFNDVKSIEIRDSMKYGVRTFGYAAINTYGGSFRNVEFGAYRMSVNNKIKKFIVIYHKDGILVFNFDSPEATQAMHDSIKKRSKNVVDDSQ
jgi:hypothetical protein